VTSAGRRWGRFGVREFQLALLQRMYEMTPTLSGAALRSLGATRAEAARAEERRLLMGTPREYGPLVRSFDWNVADYSAVLGDPASKRPHDGSYGHDGGGWLAFNWDLPVWPDLWFEVLEAPNGCTWNCRLTRRAGSKHPPQIDTAEHLMPWSCVYDEVERRFGPLDQVDGMGAVWTLAFTAPDAAGRPRRYTADFIWGLLQSLRAGDQC
jgi:hypothetical protein